jgi:hypothetical protein
MLAIILFILAIIFTFTQLHYQKKRGWSFTIETFLSYLFLLNIGIMGILAAYAHIFMGPEIARQIGWAPGSPFQFEMGLTNLSYGILGVLAFWIRGRFWDALVIGWSVLFLGCFVGHAIDYVVHHNNAPLNFGVYIWFADLFLPILISVLFIIFRRMRRTVD